MDIKSQKLPCIYKRCGKECYLDPIRKKLIFITPEETVRQRVISYLINELKVPVDMIGVEEHLSHYGLNSKLRADILIHKYDEEKNVKLPIAVIECKAQGVFLGEKALNQVVDYANKLCCDYIMLSDGIENYCYKYYEEENVYKVIEDLPKYSDMLKGEYKEPEECEIRERAKFEELNELSKEYIGFCIGKDTVETKQIAMTNLFDCLVDLNHKMPCKNYKNFKLIEDYGIRLLTYGNASGGTFQGFYRSFLVEYKGSTEFVSITISTCVSWSVERFEKTVINVAIDNEKTSHHSLQFSVDKNLTIIGDECRFWHEGRISIGNLGSGKAENLRDFVSQRCPDMVKDNKVVIGTINNDRLWNLDDKQVTDLIENFISYALIRDEYREYVKQNKSSCS